MPSSTRIFLCGFAARPENPQGKKFFSRIVNDSPKNFLLGAAKLPLRITIRGLAAP